MDESVQELLAQFLVCHLASTISQNHLYFIPSLQKVKCVFHLSIEIVVIDMEVELHFLDFLLDLFFFGIALPFFFLVLEFSEVHDPADGRFCLAGHFDQVEAFAFSPCECVLKREQTELFTI